MVISLSLPPHRAIYQRDIPFMTPLPDCASRCQTSASKALQLLVSALDFPGIRRLTSQRTREPLVQKRRRSAKRSELGINVPSLLGRPMKSLRDLDIWLIESDWATWFGLMMVEACAFWCWLNESTNGLEGHLCDQTFAGSERDSIAKAQVLSIDITIHPHHPQIK